MKARRTSTTVAAAAWRELEPFVHEYVAARDACNEFNVFARDFDQAAFDRAYAAFNKAQTALACHAAYLLDVSPDRERYGTTYRRGERI